MSEPAANLNLGISEKIRIEMLDGKIYNMAPPNNTTVHVDTSGNIYLIFRRFVDGKKCRAFPDSMKLELSKKDKFYPDAMIVCDPSKIKPGIIKGAPDLVVEVLSKSSVNRDRVKKFNLYEQHGIKEYWLVDTNSELIEVYVLTNGKYSLYGSFTTPFEEWQLEDMPPDELAEVVSVFTSPTFPEMTINLEEIFIKY